MSKITTYCRITEKGYRVQGGDFIPLTGDSFSENLSHLYKDLKLEYPKFHKMDLLSKAAVLGVELMLQSRTELLGMDDNEVALCFGNSESSEYSDKKFYTSYHHGENPSPSHFVYTLPNILIGEIAIKNKWYGENLFLIFPKFEATEFYEQIEILLHKGSACCICGWVDVSRETIDAFFYVVENSDGVEFSANSLEEIYKLDHA